MNQAVIWAIDPFESETKPERAVLKEFFEWMDSAGLPVQPVHILGFSTTNLSDEYLKDDLRSLPSADKAARAYLESLGVKRTLPPRVILTPANSRKKEVQKILALAELSDSPMIVVSSHGRSGLERLAMGSFAETLLLESKRPVLFLTHLHPKGAGKIRKVLFPTDFSENSRMAFRKFLPHAKALKAELVLFYSASLPPIALSSGSLYDGVASPIPEDYFNNLISWAKQEGSDWIDEAKKLGIPAEVLVKNDGVSSDTAGSILRTAREEKVQLIAMASLSGPFTSFVLGSVAREVFRTRQFPVWVFGPKSLEDQSLDLHSSPRKSVETMVPAGSTSK